MTSLVSHDEKAATAAAFSSSTTDDPQQQLLLQQQQRSHKVRVAVRVRPMNTKESSSSEVRQIVKVPPASSPMANSVVVDGATPEQLANRRLTKSIVHGAQQFDGFYKVFSPHAQQEDVFEDTAREIIEDAFRGLNGSLMAYGSTGSGKTHSTFGSELSSPGIIPRAAALIFKRKQELENFEGKYVTVKLYFLEVYQESCRDLLNAANICQLRDKVIGGVGPNGTACEVAGVKYVYPTSASQMLNIIDQGFTQRVSHETHANQHSSRSHAILSIEIEVRETPEASSGLLGKLKFCDLAGSERAAATKNDGLRFREGANINKSLLALGNVIQALAKPNALQNFIPYRGSKLTRLLRESLGGNCTSILLVCVAPSSLSAEETLNTMHYATLAKKISTQVRVNTVEVSPEALKEQYELALSKKDQEIDALKEELRKLYAERISLGITGGGGAAGGENENQEDQEAADNNENENDGNLLHFHSDGTQEGGDANTTSPLAKHPAERGSATFSPGSTGRLSSASKEPVHKNNINNNNFNSGELFSTSLSPDRMMNIATSRLKALSKKNSREIGVQTAPSPQNFMMQFNASSTSPYPTPIFNFGSNEENADLDVSEENSNQHNINSDTSLDSPFAQNNNNGNANQSKPNSRFHRKLSITSVRGGGGELPPLSGFACATSNSTAAPSLSHDSAATNNNNYNLHQQQHLESLLLGDLSRSSATSTNFKLLSEKLNSLREFRENIYTDSQMYGEAGDLNLETAIRVASSEIISYLGNHHVAKSEEVDEAGNLIVLSSSSLKLVPVGIHGFQDEIATKREQRIQNDRRRDELQQQLMSYSSQLAALNKEIFNCNDFSSEFERHELKHRLELQKERMACLEAQEFASFYLEEKKREHQLNNEFRSALSRCGDILQRYLDILSFSGTEKDMDEFDRNAKHRREVQSLLENLRAPVTDTESMVPTAVDNFDEYCRFNGELLHQFRITYSTNLRKQQEEDGKRAREHKKRVQKEKLNKLAAEDDECERMDEDRQADIENTLRELRFTNNHNSNNLSQSQNNNNNENKTNANDNDENDPLGGTHSALDRARLRKLQKQNQPSSKQTASNNNNTAANSNQPNIMISSSSKEFFVTNNNNENENENQNTSGGNCLSIQRRKSTAVDVFADDNDDDDNDDDEEYDDQTPNSKRLPKNIESNSSSTTTPFVANKNKNNSSNNNFVNASSPATAKEPIQPPVPFHKRVVIPSHLDVTQKRISTSMSLLGSSSSTPHRRNNNNSNNETLNSLSSPSPQQGSGTGSSQAFWGNSTRRSRNALAHQISLKVNHSEGSNNKTTSSISSSAIPSLANTTTTAMASPSATLSLLMQNHLLHHAPPTTSGTAGGVVSNTSFSSASHHTSSNPGSATKPQRVSSYSQMHLNHLNHHQHNQNQPPQQLNTALLSNSAATISTANVNSNNNNNNQQNPNLNSNSFSSQHNSFAMDEKKNTSEFLLFSSSNQHNDDLSFSSQRDNNNNGNGNEQDNHGEEFEGDEDDDDDANNNSSMGPAEKAAMIRALQANKYSANHFVNPNHQQLPYQKSQNNTSSSPRTNNNKSNNTSSPPSSSNTNNFQRQNTATSTSTGNAKKNSFDNNAAKTLSSSPSPPNKHNPSTYQRESSPKATSVLGNNNNNDKSNVSSPSSSPRIGSVSTQQQRQQLHVDPQSNNNNSVLQRSSSSLMGGSTYSTATTNSATENNNNNNNVVIPTTPTTASAANNKKQQNTSNKDAIGNSPGLYSNAPLVRKNTSTAVGKAGTTEKDSTSPIRNTKEVVSSTAQTPKQQQQSSAKTKINANNNNNKILNEKTLEQSEKNNNKVPPPPTLSINNLSALLATPSKSNQNSISTTTTTPTTPTVTASSTRVTSGRVSAAQLKLQQQQQIINNNNNATPSSNINNNNTSTISTATTASTTAGVKRVSEIKAALQNAVGDTDKKNTEHPTIIKSSYASIHNTKLHQHSQQPVPPPPPLPSTPKISTSAAKAKTTDDSQINNSSSTPTTMSVLATTPFAGRSSKPRENSGENTNNNNNTESSQNSNKHNDATPSNNANTKQNNTNKNQLQTDDSNKRSNRLLDKLTRNAPGVLQSVNLLSMSTSATSNNGSTVESNATATTGRGNAMVMTTQQQQHQKNNFSSSSITNASTSASFSKKQQPPQQKVVVASSVECSAVKQQNEDSVLLEEVNDNNNIENNNVVMTPENYNDREFVNQNISALTEQLQQHEENDNNNDNNGFEENDDDDDDDDENNIHNIVCDENSGSPILNETKLGTLEQNQSQDNNNNNQQQNDGDDDDQSETSPELLRPNVLLFEGSGNVDEDAANDEL